MPIFMAVTSAARTFRSTVGVSVRESSHRTSHASVIVTNSSKIGPPEGTPSARTRNVTAERFRCLLGLCRRAGIGEAEH